ncbi:MAG: redoxin domain-containing protein [Gemmatimonadetes bacterium]|jgi:cytochrome c biogenesis protein CcmG/thiol:disulfide interchange protein DsbE|nr:redoxin domain-containing protein [Gemmatimonadota bacterium]
MNWKRAASAAAVAVPIIALLGYGMTRDPKEIPSPLPGREAPTFSLAVFAEGQGDQLRPVGDTVSLADHSGEVVVLNFWASWCLACRDEHSTLSSVAEAYAGKGVKFYGVLYNDVPANGTRWISEMGGQSYPSLNDPRTRTAIDYGLYGVPETFFIARDGRVAYKHVGPVTAQVLAYKLDSLLAQPAPGGAPRRAPGDSAKSVTVPTSGS